MKTETKVVDYGNEETRKQAQLKAKRKLLAEVDATLQGLPKPTKVRGVSID